MDDLAREIVERNWRKWLAEAKSQTTDRSFETFFRIGLEVGFSHGMEIGVRSAVATEPKPVTDFLKPGEN